MGLIKSYKQKRALKKLKLQLEVDLLSKIYSVTEEIKEEFDKAKEVTDKANESNISTDDVVKIAEKLKDVDKKDIVKEIVKTIKKDK